MLLMIEKPRQTSAERAWTALARSAAALPTLVDALVMWPFRVGENRRTLAALAAMSDHDLQDIGLTRADLRDSMALPPGREAGAFLARRRSARRHRA